MVGSNSARGLACRVWRPRIAMAFAIAGLFADGETVVQEAECIRESYPGFEAVLEEFTNPKRMQISTPVIGSLTPGPVEEEA